MELEEITCNQAVMKSGLGCDPAKNDSCVSLNIITPFQAMAPFKDYSTFASQGIKLYR